MSFQLFVYGFVGLIILAGFYNVSLSLALYLSYIILVPGLKINLGGFQFSDYHLIIILFLLSLPRYYRQSKSQLSLVPITPFVFLLISLLVLGYFTDVIPFSDQLTHWRGAFITVAVLGFIFWNQLISDPKCLRYITIALLISISIAGLYGLYLTRLDGSNPYTSMAASFFKTFDAAELYSETNSQRLDFSKAEKIQATMSHPMTWALVLCLTTFQLIISLIKDKRNKIYWAVLVLVSVNILISGVRTSIAALAIGTIYFLIRYRKLKIIAIAIVSATIMLVIIKSDKDLNNLFTSYFDISGNESNVKGSSIQLRLEQLNGALHEIKGYELTGKGYDWTSLYMEKYGEHPVLLAFESLVFTVLCNSGILGVVLWLIFFVLLFRVNRKLLFLKLDRCIADAFVIVYLAYTIGTGDYGYLVFFSMFYILTLYTLIQNESEEEQLVVSRASPKRTPHFLT